MNLLVKTFLTFDKIYLLRKTTNLGSQFGAVASGSAERNAAL
jgi:hypothetical protein